MYGTLEPTILPLKVFGGSSIEYLLETGVIAPYSNDNRPWRNSILPRQDDERLGNLVTNKPYGSYSHRLQASIVERSAFGTLDILDKVDALFDETRGVLGADGKPHPVWKRYIAKEIGSYTDSVKRYKDLEDPLSMKLPGWQRYIAGVCQWAEAKGVQKIFCVTEYRPHVVDKNYVLNASYFTVRGI